MDPQRRGGVRRVGVRYWGVFSEMQSKLKFYSVNEFIHTFNPRSGQSSSSYPLVGQGAHYVGQLSQLLYKKNLKNLKKYSLKPDSKSRTKGKHSPFG